MAEADGVVLGWQARTILIWWLPGMIFVALAWLETRSPAVTAGLAAFCVGLFLFYSFDREVRPRSRRRRYVLTERRLLIASAGEPSDWRPLDLAEVAATRMEDGIADRAVGRLSGAATIVLQLRLPGPKGEPRTLRIGPMRRPGDFRRSIVRSSSSPGFRVRLVPSDPASRSWFCPWATKISIPGGARLVPLGPPTRRSSSCTAWPVVPRGGLASRVTVEPSGAVALR